MAELQNHLMWTKGMENREKPKELLTYRRATKRQPEVAETDSKNSVSNLSENCRDEIVVNRPCEPCVVASSHTVLKRNSTQEAEKIIGLQPSFPSLLGAFPKRQRSKRRVIQKNVAKILKAERHPSLPTFKPRSGACQKRKSKQEDNVASDSELASPSSLSAFRCRGQWKRRANSNNTITQQQGKLDTNTFECYLENLWRSFSQEKRNSFVYLDCLWFSLYTKDSSREKVLSWIKKRDIFSKKYVFVPVVQWCHWSLLILCHLGEGLQSKTRTPCILLLDSLHMANPRRLEPKIRRFVLDIYKAEERLENKKLISKIPLLVPKVPQQRNDEECGSLVLYYLNLFVNSAPEFFSISEGYPYFMKEDWFTREGLECFCKQLDSFS